ncbi:hypothetical protein QJS10_CPA01g01940 [Acorus calamus]|uniref:Uncharacterized protein n=1 Tax=Acorus calamus TaxID=4465 RepID=A0AAV9FK37_ACOCL|nr:hypothetical protein QJS10_CPA01g01940 [Acorus calamus]
MRRQEELGFLENTEFDAKMRSDSGCFDERDDRKPACAEGNCEERNVINVTMKMEGRVQREVESSLSRSQIYTVLNQQLSNRSQLEEHIPRTIQVTRRGRRWRSRVVRGSNGGEGFHVQVRRETGSEKNKDSNGRL